MEDFTEIIVCMGSSCYSRGNNETINIIKDFLIEKGLDNKVIFKGELCSCNCKNGPNLRIGNFLYNNIDSACISTILEDHFLNNA
jgi:NADH:ubiquinone oxidoreductase subunit E